MFRAYIALILATLLILAPATAATRKGPIQALDGVVLLLNLPDQCSAFQISALTYVTAAHCVRRTEYVQLIKRDKPVGARVTKVDVEHDLALVESGLNLGHPLPIGAQPDRGDILYMLGYGGNSPFPFYLGGAYMGVYMVMDRQMGIESPRGIVLAAPMGGMSGGPTINTHNEVVGVNQMTTGFMGAISEYRVFRDFIKH